jgi:DGQHR domain-containing protein
MDQTFIAARYGDLIDFGPCLVGRNLNLLTLRGYARLDQLAVVSAPDIYDMKQNALGTQRDLNLQHARECRAYAMDAVGLPPEEDCRFFPEVILNGRDSGVVEIYELDDPNNLLDLDSLSDPAELDTGPAVGLRIRVADVEFPKKTLAPQVSRVDGNHRLFGTDELLESAAEGNGTTLDDDFPMVPFALLLELSPDQEAKLFRDINGEHKGMETAHLTQLTARLADPEKLKSELKFRALWIAIELTNPGRAFEGMVFMGGSKAGVKKEGFIPPIKVNALKTTIQQMLKSAQTASTVLENNPDALLNLIDNFWKAVRAKFHDAWENKKDYILLQAIGLGAFAKFGGVILDRAFEETSVEQEDFEKYLAPVVEQVSLERSEYPGIAGAGGVDYVAKRLISAAGPEAVKTAKVLAALTKEATIEDKLGS